jgi:mannosyltransferase OCH1-like enzyme
MQDISKNIVVNKEKIPKIIIHTWKSNEIPPKYDKDIESLKKFNPDFEFKFFTDEEIEQFLKDNYPEYYLIYQKLPIKIQKIDYFRYVAIYHFGGFYFDLDITGLRPLSELCDNSCIFPIDTHISKLMYIKSRFNSYKNKINILLGQYAFAAEPNHPFVKILITSINDNINKYIVDSKKPYGKTKVYVYKSTGPDYVTNIYLNYKNKNQITILKNKTGQYFGNYAKHNAYGTWK